MMIEQIANCRKCSLYLNQKPVLDTEKRCQVFWVGLSAKKVLSDFEIPLSSETNTGMLIQKIENLCGNVVTYKTNLVKCLPLTEQKKLRYPCEREMDSCFENLLTEIHAMSPKIIFLLGERVYSSVGKNLKIDFEKWHDFEYVYRTIGGIHYVPIQHPSYIYVYKRTRLDDYVNSIGDIIHQLL